MKKATLVSICCVLLASCATGYHKYSWTGGYKDTDLGDGRYLVEYHGNGITSVDIVEQYWSQRASELCPYGYKISDDESGANDAGFLVGGAMPIAHPWKKAVIQCK